MKNWRILFTALLSVASPSDAAPLHIQFVHEVGAQPLLSDSLRYENAAGETLSLTRLAWLGTEFSVTFQDGTTATAKDAAAYVSIGGGQVSLTDVPAQKVTAISFHVGPDNQLNHADPARQAASSPLNPNVNGLHWDWQGGYIFMALEGHWRAPDAKLPSGYSLHFARDPNRTHISLPVTAGLRDETRITIALDALKVMKGISFARDGATTHSLENDPVAARIKTNLATAFRIKAVEAGGVPRPADRPKPIDLPANPQGYPITIPRHIPIPALPYDNPVLKQRVALGEKLFQETKLSRTNTLSCVSCHRGELGSDPRQFSPGVDGKHGQRHSMPLFNLAWKTKLFWDGRASSLREQVLIPIQDPLEMGETLENVVAKLKSDPAYPPLFADAFGSGEIKPQTIGLALENFLLTRLSFDSKPDKALQGGPALTEQEQRGFEIFFTEFEPRMGKRGADCFHCHGGANFTDHSFHNNGLKTTDDLGLGKITGQASDAYKFSTPSLRNISRTAPYMHDGRFTTLEQVIEHYNQAPTLSPTLDPNMAKHRTGLNLSGADKAALIAFLKTL